jgi:hypothetical protein
MTTPAETIIEKFGGARVVAEILGITTVSVHRMKYPVERGGTGGLIPSKHQQILLDAACARGVALSHADFFFEKTVEDQGQ